jgi:hypothetical protein
VSCSRTVRRASRRFDTNSGTPTLASQSKYVAVEVKGVHVNAFR